jgi:hypothetical protein
VLLLLEAGVRVHPIRELPMSLWQVLAEAEPSPQAAPGATHEEVGSVKGGQYPDASDERSGDMLRNELQILEKRIHIARPGAELRQVQRQIKDIQFELVRRLQNGDTR